MSTFTKLPEAVRRKQILAAALRVFAKDGYNRATMSSLAQAAGLTKGGVYFHFQSKEEVFTAMMQDLFQRQMERVEQLLAGFTHTPRLQAMLGLLGPWWPESRQENPLTPAIIAACLAIEPTRIAWQRHTEHLTALLTRAFQSLDPPLQRVSPSLLAELLMVFKIGSIWKMASSTEQEREAFQQRVTRGLLAMLGEPTPGGAA